MASDLGVTQSYPVGLYYQWGTGYGYNPYISNLDAAYNKAVNLSDQEYTLFESYDLDALGNSWSDEEDPCPTGFHVPSMKEWNNLFISWCENDEECDARDLTGSDYPGYWALNDPEWHGAYKNLVLQFMDDYRLGLGGSLDGYNINMFNMMGDYRSSERLLNDEDSNYHYEEGQDKSSRGLTIYPEGGVGPLGFFSNMGASVRCFADVDGEVAAPVALDLYNGECSQKPAESVLAEASAIQVLEDSLLCVNGGYLGRKFVPAGEPVDINSLIEMPPVSEEGNQRVWYLDDDKQQKLTVNTFSENTTLYAFEEESLDEYRITFDSNGGTPNPVAQSIVYGSTATEPSTNPTKNGYTFGGWMLDGVEFNFSTPITGNITLTAKWEILHYNITYKDGESTLSGLEPSSYTIEDNVILPTLPEKTGYKFDGWLDNGIKITKIKAGDTGDKTLTAKWTENKPSGGYSGGGGSSRGTSKGSGPSSSDVKSVDKGPDTQTKTEPKPEVKPVVKPVNNGGTKASSGKVSPAQELADAYKWAYANGLTKYANMSDARLDDYLNRQEMAKISTIFATKFHGETPNEAKRKDCSQYPDLWKTTSDMQEFIKQSCELGYMGYRANGVDYLERFRPYTPVSVAEVSIILSRIMWKNKYAISENKWYQGHLHAVYENQLLDDITKPFDYITRRDAYIMLYRLSDKL